MSGFAPITVDDERERFSGIQEGQIAPPNAQMIQEPVTILEFLSEENTAKIFCQDGQEYEVRVRTPFHLIHLVWGDPAKIKGVNGVLTYRFFRNNGYVDLAINSFAPTDQLDKAITKPFSF